MQSLRVIESFSFLNTQHATKLLFNFNKNINTDAYSESYRFRERKALFLHNVSDF